MSHTEQDRLSDVEARVKIENAMRINYSDEQWEVVSDSKRPSSVVSCAGSGKTTVLIARLLYKELVEGIKPYRILVITFNKKASEEVEERYQRARRKLGLPNFMPSFYTFHAFFLRLLRTDSKYEGFTVTNSNKYLYILSDLVKTHQTLKANVDLVKDILATRSYGINNKKDFMTHNEFGEMGRNVLTKYEELLAENNELDFDDMLLLLYRELFEFNNQDIVTTFKDSFDMVMIDEFQDISGIQYDIIEELTLSIGMERITAIGDDDQASLATSRVLMRGGSTKMAQDIEIGDRVVSYKMGDAFELSSDSRYGRGYKVLDKRMHSEEGALEVVTESGHRSTYSKGHIAIAKLTANREDRVLYLMKNREGYYRVGVTLMYRNENHHPVFGLKRSMRLDKGSEGWVLGVVSSDRNEAFKEAERVSREYGVPRTLFNQLKHRELLDEDKIDSEDGRVYVVAGQAHEVYTEDTKEHIEEGAMRLLEAYGREKDYPLCSKDDPDFYNVHYTSNASFKIRACNLIPEMFEMVVRNPDNSLDRSKLVEVNYIPGVHDFVSLKVEGYKTYVSDNVVTHNCIYEFRGSNPRYITQFGNMLPSAKTHLLTVNFRCPREILAFVAPSIYKNSKRVAKALQTSREGGDVNFLGVKEDEPLVQSLVNDYRLNKSVAVLVRNNHQKTVISDRLMRKGVPVDMGSSNYTVKNNQVFKKLTMFIDMIRESDNNSFIKYYWMFNVSRNQVQAIKTRYRGTDEFWVEDVLENDMWDVPNSLKRIIQTMLQEDSAEKLYKHAMTFFYDSFRSGAKKGFYNMGVVEDYYHYIVDSIAKEVSYSEFKERINYYQKFVDRNIGNKKAIQVVTMHTVKGLEYDTVVVYDPSDTEMFPEFRGLWEKASYRLNKTEKDFRKMVFNYDQRSLEMLAYYAGETGSNKMTAEDVKDRIESERRLYYVACTRAKQTLYVATDLDRWSSLVMESLAHRGEVEIPLVPVKQFVERKMDEVAVEAEIQRETQRLLEEQRQKERQARLNRRKQGLSELESLLGDKSKTVEVDKTMSLGNIGKILGMEDEE